MRCFGFYGFDKVVYLFLLAKYFFLFFGEICDTGVPRGPFTTGSIISSFKLES